MPAVADTPKTEQTPLPFEPYHAWEPAELESRILAVKRAMGRSLMILGHHYQQDEVIQFADLRGDSYKLARLAAESAECRWIVFCGVHFMAETADILTGPDVRVVLPDLAAGCSMADMADLDAVEAAWADLGEVIDTDELMPVTYINSSADLKAFCGEHGGIVCTSSNARAVLDWAFARRQAGPLLPRPAPRAEHGPENGHPAGADAGLGPAPADGRQHRGRPGSEPGPALAGPLLGPPDVPAAACRAVPRAVIRGFRCWCIRSA